MTIEILAQTNGLADACGVDPDLLCEFVYEQTGSESLASLTELAGRPIAAIGIIAVAWLINGFVRRLIARMMVRVKAAHEERLAEEVAALEAAVDIEKKPSLAEHELDRARRLHEASDRSQQRTETLGAVLKNIASIVIYTVAFIMALGEFEVNLGPLIASAGIVGIALGFGAQSLVKDFLSGFFMLIEDQYGVGDVIDVGEATGTVERVQLRITQLRDVNGTLWHVPNGEIRRVGNKSQAWARTVLDIEVAYDTDLTHAMEVIKRVADGVWQEGPPDATILEEPELWGVERFGENAVVIRLAMKVEPAEQFVTARVIRGRLKEAFDAEGIEIPFPQRTIWVNQVVPGRSKKAADEDHGHEALLTTDQPEAEVE